MVHKALYQNYEIHGPWVRGSEVWVHGANNYEHLVKIYEILDNLLLYFQSSIYTYEFEKN